MPEQLLKQQPPAQSAASERPTVLERLHRALGPLAGGIIIDCVDFATFGPVGLVLGPIAGGLAGWWVSSLYRFETRGRLIVALLAAIYCTIPFTELLPLATIVAACARYWDSTPTISRPVGSSAQDTPTVAESSTDATERPHSGHTAA